MADEKIGLVETVSMAVGGMVGGGIFAALAIAAEPFFGVAGFVVISVAGLFSTASALNATLISAARLSKMMVRDDFLPNS